jgi:hypothetical protein
MKEGQPMTDIEKAERVLELAEARLRRYLNSNFKDQEVFDFLLGKLDRATRALQVAREEATCASV